MNTLPQPSLHFRLLPTGERSDGIWPMLEAGLWKQVRPNIHEQNTLSGLLRRDSWQPILPGVQPMYTGMVWCPERHASIEPHFRPIRRDTNSRDLIAAVEKLFDRFEGRHIGVQLSGGLDSSIIIALLKRSGRRFSLVGMTTERYEFRTERHIQHLLAEWGDNTILIDFDAHLPFSDLNEIPAHQVPDISCLTVTSNNAMASACEKLGIDVLFTGNGGDNVFAESMPTEPDRCPWMPQLFADGWLDDLVYAPSGVQVVPFYADPGILNALYNLRCGHDEDTTKRWSRHYFKDYLPRELVDYTYCADFWGLYVDGFQNALPTVRKLFENAYDLIAHPGFAPTALDALLRQDLLTTEKSTYQRIESHISTAVWLNSLGVVPTVPRTESTLTI